MFSIRIVSAPSLPHSARKICFILLVWFSVSFSYYHHHCFEFLFHKHISNNHIFVFFGCGSISFDPLPSLGIFMWDQYIYKVIYLFPFNFLSRYIFLLSLEHLATFFENNNLFSKYRRVIWKLT